MALYLDIRVGDSVEIDGGRIVVQLTEKTGRRARIRVDAARDIPVKITDRSKTTAEGAGVLITKGGDHGKNSNRRK